MELEMEKYCKNSFLNFLQPFLTNCQLFRMIFYQQICFFFRAIAKMMLFYHVKNIEKIKLI